MKGWRDTEEESEEFKTFRHGYFSLGAACGFVDRTRCDQRMVKGGEEEEEEEGEKKKLVPISVRYQEIKSHL